MDTELRSFRMRINGFSLIELMVVISIAVILLGIGVPNFTGLVRSHQVSTTANDLVAAINLARAEAIQRGQRVDLVAIDNDWEKGWVVFIDQNNNQRVDADEHVIFRQDSLPIGMTVTSRLTDNGRYLIYNGTGRTHTRTNLQRPQSGSIRFVLGDEKRNVVLNMLGRARVCTPKTGTESC